MKTEDINIGKTIRTVCKQRGFTLVSVAKELGMAKQNLDYLLNKEDFPVKTLFTISKFVGYDFVDLFTQPKEDEQTTEVTLQIKIAKDKSDEVLRYIKDKELYEILTKK
ncbi:MAG: helix-turn-helix transcriptional regulator [bacterium]|nr:helix-turn-helix transcriptional regulator [Candidatus Limimorpha caballi]